MKHSSENRSIIVGMTGASGACYGLRLVKELLGSGAQVALLLSDTGRGVLRHETDLDVPVPQREAQQLFRDHFAVGEQLRHYAIDDLFAPPASGSSRFDSMVVCPCSMGSVGRMAAGQAGNLLERAADVMLKERRPLILVPRETPLGILHLENLLRLARAGAQILPAAPAFYQRPETVPDLIDFIVARILSQLNIASDHLLPPWGLNHKP